MTRPETGCTPRWLCCLLAVQVSWLAGCAQPPTLSGAELGSTSPMPADPLHTIMPAAQIARAVGWQLAATPRAERIPLARVVSLAVSAGPNSDALWRLTEPPPASGSGRDTGRPPR